MRRIDGEGRGLNLCVLANIAVKKKREFNRKDVKKRKVFKVQFHTVYGIMDKLFPLTIIRTLTPNDETDIFSPALLARTRGDCCR